MRETRPVIRNFVQINESHLALADGADDIRDRSVVDRSLALLGRVDDLFIDEDEGRVCFLRISLGPDLSGRAITFLVPTEAITEVSAETIRTDLSRPHKSMHPLYNPGLVMRPPVDYFEDGSAQLGAIA